MQNMTLEQGSAWDGIIPSHPTPWDGIRLKNLPSHPMGRFFTSSKIKCYQQRSIFNRDAVYPGIDSLNLGRKLCYLDPNLLVD